MNGELGNQHLRDFQDNEKSIPTILTTSQKLSTGVDARNVRNIVLMRPINSIIEFKQIVGRGTRLYEGKDYFTIYDFVTTSPWITREFLVGKKTFAYFLDNHHGDAIVAVTCKVWPGDNKELGALRSDRRIAGNALCPLTIES